MSSGVKITKKILDSAARSHAGSTSQIVELHGLWNSYFCGSFLQEGDTRVFFLRKVPDRRQSVERQKRSSKKENGKKRKCRKGKKRRKNKKTCNKRFTAFELKKGTKKGKTKKIESRKTKSKQKKLTPNLPASTPTTLLVNGEPSRITLNNLNNIKSVIHA